MDLAEPARADNRRQQIAQRRRTISYKLTCWSAHLHVYSMVGCISVSLDTFRKLYTAPS